MKNQESVRVVVRLRPLSQAEGTLQQKKQSVQARGNKLFIADKVYEFKHLIPPHASQADAQQQFKIEEFVDRALEGGSSTIMAYGQTGSGKTYTMRGKSNKLEQGLMMRSAQYLFFKLKQVENFTVKASFFEIYNERIRDLLNPKAVDLVLRENTEAGFFVENLLMATCQNCQDIFTIIEQATANRKTSYNWVNKDSSRSHAILHIWLITQHRSQRGITKKYGKISFIDLAGSQRLKIMKNQSQIAKQTSSINKSLFTLGRVIKTIAQGRGDHIPFRDSKLTMLLTDMFKPDSKVLFIACISSNLIFLDQTISTLNYASHMLKIRETVVMLHSKPVNQRILSLKRQIRQLRQTNNQLRKSMQSRKQQSPDKQMSRSSIIEQYRERISKLQQQVIRLHQAEEDEQDQGQIQQITVLNYSLRQRVAVLETTIHHLNNALKLVQK